MSTTTGERASRLDGHPTVISVRARQAAEPAPPPRPAVLDHDELRALCLAAGADDTGFVEVPVRSWPTSGPTSRPPSPTPRP